MPAVTDVAETKTKTTINNTTTAATAATTATIQNDNNYSIAQKAAPILNVPIQSITWIKLLELCYSLPDTLPFHNTNHMNPATITHTSQQQQRSSICFHCKAIEGSTTCSSSNDSSSCVNQPDSDEATKTTTTTTTNPTSCFKFCSKCNIAKYCCRDCQIQDWKQYHKRSCTSYQRMKKVIRDTVVQQDTTTTTTTTTTRSQSIIDPNVNDNKEPNNNNNNNNNNALQLHHQLHTYILRSEEIKSQVRDELFGKIRFYVCSYAVQRYQELGCGFLFVQFSHTIEDHSLVLPINCYGTSIPGLRTCLVHYITVGEYDQEICRNDFEMTLIRKELYDNIQLYDPKHEVVIFMRFRCGHCALGRTTLVPDYKKCQRLGRDYYFDASTNTTIGSLQLNLDE